MKVIEKLDFSVDYIAHIADVHIRNVKRHTEYQEVFDRLYVELKKLSDSHKNFAIYLGGDIVHAKLDMSPELISVTYKFLKSCADIAPTLLILGNHDCNLNNKSRLDALTPIVESLNHPNLFFLKDTGIYRAKNVDFVLWSILDDPKNYKVPKKGTSKQILFYHGAIDSALTENNISIKNDKLNVRSLTGFDYVLMGDIHMRQYLDESNTIAYCGSLIQQNFGESLNRGFLFWNIKTGFSKFIPIKNDYGFYTLEAKAGRWVKESFPEEFGSKPLIRIKSYDTDQGEMTKLVASLKSTINVEDIKIQKINTKPDVAVNKISKTGDIRDVEYQNKLILSFIEKNTVLRPEIKNKIFEINRRLNTNIDLLKTIKNIIWTPIKFEFSNMFSYGEDNEITFDSMGGIYGLFASNAAGKSSILDALMFCMFDKCSRTFKAAEVLNTKKDSFMCKLTFKIHDKHYAIERVGIKDSKQHVKVTVNFYTYDSYGNYTLLNGANRDETNKAIREYIGNYDEFVLTTLSLQNNNSNFVDKAQRERKDLLSQFLDLNVFEELTQLAATEANQIKALIKEYTKQDFASQLAAATENKKNNTVQLQVLKKQKDEISRKIDNINADILQLISDSETIDTSLLQLDISALNSEELKIKEKLDICLSKKQQSESDVALYQTACDDLEQQLNFYNESDILRDKKNKEKIQDSVKNFENKLKEISIKSEHLISKIDTLKNHEYDPECKYCINNQFVKDAERAKEELVKIRIMEKEVLTALDSEKISLAGCNNADEVYDKYLSIKNEFLGKKSKLNEFIVKVKDIELMQAKLETVLKEISLNKERYAQNQEFIEKNKIINENVNVLNVTHANLTRELSNVDSQYIDASSQVKVYESIIKSAKENIEKLSNLHSDYKAYELYIKATNRNGVPYDLIADVLPQIENEANEILSYLVDFKIMLDSDGKSINIFIMYDESRIWALELASGMEKFISSIAIRNALINYSNLPRPNFIAIDEGFGVLDSENIAALYNVFQYLKSQYQFILIISHIDSLKDMAEHQIEIYRNDAGSKVIF